jgi:hypothetical protein
MNFHHWTRDTRFSRFVNLRNILNSGNPPMSSSASRIRDKFIIAIVVAMRIENKGAVSHTH